MAKIILSGSSTGNKLSAILMEDSFEDFIRFSKAKNLSPETITNYERQFKAFHNFYSGDITQITEDTVIQYIEYMQERLLSPTSINTALRHLKAVLNYWAVQDFIKPVKIKLLKVNEQIKATYTDEEISRLLKKPDIKKTSFCEYRTWAIINFLIGTGCRISTLINVKIEDIDWENELIAYTHTKNKKAQFTPISKQLAVILQDYLRQRGGETTDLIFPSENNTKLVRSSVAHDLAKYNRKRGVAKTSAHLFRHTFAKNWILQGGDTLRLQKVLGHSSLQMVQHYANLYKHDLKKGYDDFNLLSRLKAQRIKLGGAKR